MMKDTDYRSPTELHLSLMAKVHTEESGGTSMNWTNTNFKADVETVEGTGMVERG